MIIYNDGKFAVLTCLSRSENNNSENYKWKIFEKESEGLSIEQTTKRYFSPAFTGTKIGRSLYFFSKVSHSQNIFLHYHRHHHDSLISALEQFAHIVMRIITIPFPFIFPCVKRRLIPSHQQYTPTQSNLADSLLLPMLIVFLLDCATIEPKMF